MFIYMLGRLLYDWNNKYNSRKDTHAEHRRFIIFSMHLQQKRECIWNWLVVLSHFITIFYFVFTHSMILMFKRLRIESIISFSKISKSSFREINFFFEIISLICFSKSVQFIFVTRCSTEESRKNAHFYCRRGK